MEENYEEINNLIMDLDKIENLIDRIILNGDFETLPKILEQRKKILEKMTTFAYSDLIKNRVMKVIEDDQERINKIKPEMESLKNQLKITNKGKVAIKNGYLKVQEEFIKRKFNSNG
jgi:6-pyruvoyl-tetrahydropterin synthase